MKKIFIVIFFLVLPTRFLFFFKEFAIRRVPARLPTSRAKLVSTRSQGIDPQNMAFSTKSRVLNRIPEVMEKEQVAQLLAEAGFPTKVVPLVTCLAQFESRFKTKAVNKNKNKTHDYGLLQINDVWLKGCKTTPSKLQNPEENARCALKIFNKQGLTAWSTYKKFKNTCIAYHVDFIKYENIADIQIPNNRKIDDLM